MPKLYTALLLLVTCTVASRSNAQPICGFDAVHKHKLETDAQYRKQVSETEALIQHNIKGQQARRAANARENSTQATLYTIPVVVHVVHTGGAVGTTYNPSDAQITRAINYLNAIYKGTHVSLDPAGAGETQLEFVMATRDPNCNPTNGIDRVDFSGNATYVASGIRSAVSNPGVDELVVKDATRWNPSTYYNIWVVNRLDGADGTSGQFLAGYAYFPGATPRVDGTVMLATQMDSLRKTLPHEIGHALSLYHVFEGSTDATVCSANTDCTTQGDRVCDTDPISYNQTGGVIDFTCRTGTNTCTSTAYSINTERNFMNYTTCFTLFTNGQKSRMLGAMSLPSRAGFVNSWGLAGTYPVASFAQPAAACAVPSTGTATSSNFAGIMSVTVNNRTFSSGTTPQDAGYVNRAGDCTSLVYLAPGGTYSFSPTVYGLNQEQIGAWIDYNNDGVFDNATEQIFYQNNIPQRASTTSYSTVSNLFTIPPTALANTVLRMRVTDDLGTAYGGGYAITGGCYASQRGQSEDLPVYISNSALPIRLEYVKGELLNNEAKVTWKTTSETNVASYEIERSYNGTDFTFIGTVTAAGNAAGSIYTYTDKTFTGEVMYYRIKQIDRSGQTFYSTTVTVKKTADMKDVITIKGNPFTDNFIISITSPLPGKVNVKLLDVTGKLVHTQSTEVGRNASISVSPNTTKLSAGVYIVQVTMNNNSLVQKIVKQ